MHEMKITEVTGPVCMMLPPAEPSTSLLLLHGNLYMVTEYLAARLQPAGGLVALHITQQAPGFADFSCKMGFSCAWAHPTFSNLQQ